MKDCKKIRKNFAAFLSGELSREEQEFIESHLETCGNCRHELKEFEKVFSGADSLNAEIEEAMLSVDWDSLPNRITNTVFESQKAPSRKSWMDKFWKPLFQPRFRPVYAGLFVGLFIGALIMFFVLRTPGFRTDKGESFIVSQEFLDKAELELARRETIDYLEKSEYLLIDFVQSSREEPSEVWQNQFSSQRARDLLSKKKYINRQLDKYKMAKAKEICDQIEILFFELSQLADDLPQEELTKIQNLIEEKQILLKIKLVKKELKQNEV
jgi:hypothetical protein